MYNGHEYLSCIKIPAAKQATTRNAHETEKAESMDLAADHRDLISTANKVFGEGKWNHTVVSQTLDFVEVIGAKCCAGCVSFVKVQIENGNFHEDIGYYSAEESTKGSSIHNARVGSAVNALKRVLLSFGGEIERELQQLQRQINSEQVNGVQRNVAQDKQIPEKSDVLIKIPASNVPQTKCTSEPKPEKTKNLVQSFRAIDHSTLIDPWSVVTPAIEANPSSSVKVESNNFKPLSKEVSATVKSEQKEAPVSTVTNCATEANPSRIRLNVLTCNKSDSLSKQVSATVKSEQKEVNIVPKLESKQELSERELQRMERKRKQMEKQMEFKRHMMEKEKLMSTDDNKPNPKY